MPKKDATDTLGTELALTDYVAPVVEEPVVDLAVESIMAINNKQIEIKFNKELDSTTAADEANYVVKDAGATTETLSATSAALQADKMTVVLTLNNAAGDKLDQSTLATVTVKKTIKDVDGNALGADFTDKEVTVFDGIAPEVTAIEATGLKTLELTLSEPTWDGTDFTLTAGNFEVKSEGYTYFVNSAVISGNTLTITTGTNLQEGDVTVTFNKLGEIKDYAGTAAFKGSIVLAYAKDTTAPVATVKEATQTSVTIQFDKPVNATGLKLYHSVSGVAAYGDTQNVTAAKTVTFDFATNKLPQGDIKLFLVNSSTASQVVTDLFGNTMADQTYTVAITVDTTAPTIAETKLNTNASFDVTFSENIDTAQAKAANFTVKKVSDAKDVAFVVTNDGAKKVTLTFNSALTDNTDYEIVVKAMKDLSGNALAAEEAFVVNAGDNTHPTVSSSYITAANTAYIVYSENMNQDDMLNKAMYIVDGTALDSADTLTAVSAKKVKITFNDNNMVGGTTDIVLGALRDEAGKSLTNATTFSTTLTDVAADTLELSKAELIAKNEIKLTFTKELANFDNTEFAIRQTDNGAISTGAIAISSVKSMTVNADGVTEVIIVLDSNIQTDAKDVAEAIEVWTVDTPANTKSVESTVLSADDAKDEVTVADKLGGAIKVTSDVKQILTKDFNTNGKIDTIVIEYDEAVKPATLSLLSYKVAGYTITAVSADADGTVVAGAAGDGAGAFVILNVTEITSGTDVAATPNVTQLLDIQDVAGNTIALTDALASADKVLPSIVSITMANATGNTTTKFDADDTIVIVFDEAIDPATLATGLTAGGSAVAAAADATGSLTLVEATGGSDVLTIVNIATITSQANGADNDGNTTKYATTLALSADAKTLTITQTTADDATATFVPGTPTTAGINTTVKDAAGNLLLTDAANSFVATGW
jgi:hypothetical protein